MNDNIETFGTPMLDGCKSGVSMGMDKVSAVDLGTEVTAKEFEYLKRTLLSKLNGVSIKNLTTANVTSSKGKSSTKDSLREGYSMAKVSCNVWKGKYFFNVEGNPISFITGQNVLGVVNLARILDLFYREVEKSIQAIEPTFKLPPSVVKAVEDLDIHIHRLAFACYTPDLGLRNWKNMNRFFHAIDLIYSGYSMLREQSVKDYFELDVVKSGPYSITFVKKDRVSRLWSLGLYNKAVELEEKFQRTAPDWVSHRIRIDLTLHSTWFERNRCKTLKDIVRKFTESYQTWIYGLIQKCMEETKVRYMLGFKTFDVDPGRYKKAYDDWSNGKEVKVTEGMAAWFEEQGLDLRIPLNIHMAASAVRATFSLADGVNDKAILGDKKASTRLATKFEDGLRNGAFLPIAKRAHLLTPDVTFGRFTREKTKNGMVWVDTSTGEVLR